MILAVTLWIFIVFSFMCAQTIYQDGQGTFNDDKTELQVYENATVGSIVLPDLRDYLQLSPDRQVQLGPGAFSSFFSLTKNNSLVVQRSLDLESGDLCRAEESCCRSEDVIKVETYPSYSHFIPSCKIKAVVLANNGESTPLRPVKRIMAVIMDLNDHAPEFILPTADANSTPQRIHVAFFEGFKGVGEKFQLPTAKDKDFLPENSMITYSIAMKKPDSISVPRFTRNEMPVPSGSPSWVSVSHFRLVYKPKGDCLTLEVTRELDRETQSDYELVLSAEDGDGQKATLIIQVHVLDVNEFEPKFVDVKSLGAVEVLKTSDPNKRVVHIYENATTHIPFVQVIAEDKDAQPANKIIYKLSPSFYLSAAASVFSIDLNTGKIILEKPLDFEETKRYVLPVLAIDANYESNSEETKLLLRSMQKISEAITGSINREPKTATMTLEIVVNDCNDHAPEIKLQGAVSNTADSLKAGIDELTVMENAPPGTALVFFSAADRDQGDAGVSECYLLNWTDRFRIHNFSDFFSLETTKELDREINPQYLLTIKCHDDGNPRQSSQKRLRLVLMDVNDEAPFFKHPLYSFRLLENSPPGTKLTAIGENDTNPVIAFDRDIASKLAYHLESDTTADLDQQNMFDYQLFSVDTESGTLYSKTELDREQKANHQFNLCADDGIYRACTSIVVNIDDANDNPPLFDKETYIIRLVENTPFFEPLIIFHITDADTGNQGFSISIETPQATGNPSDLLNTSENLYPFFAIRDNYLYLRHPLDRETKSHYYFFVRVRDSQNFGSGNAQQSLSSTAEVFIEVCDINDNSPVFIFPNASAASEGGNQLNVSCRETMGSSVGRIVAIDLDLEQNGTVVYSVIQSPMSNELFYLDKQTGELFVNSGRLSENCDSVFLLVISADDMGPLSSKKGRPIPVERLIIRLQDQPTLAEYMSLAYQQATFTKGSSNDTQSGKHFFSFSFKTMLSVILGGCIVFLTGLLLAWITLILISRSKHRRRELNNETQYPSVPSRCCESGAFLSDGKHEIFVHPADTYSHGLGLTESSQFLQCTLGEKDGDGPRLRDLNATSSTRASPYDHKIIVDTIPPGGVLTCALNSNASGRTSRLSPINDTVAVSQSSWNKAGGTNPFQAPNSKLTEKGASFVMLPTDAAHIPTPVCSGESAHYFLLPTISATTTGVINLPGTSHIDGKTHSLLKFAKHKSKVLDLKSRCRSQCATEECETISHQNNHLHGSAHQFLTPPPQRKSSKSREADEVVENAHFMLSENQYTPLMESTPSSQVACENQYLIVTSRNTEMPSVYNTITRPVPRDSSIPRSSQEFSRSLEGMNENQTVFECINEDGRVILTSSMPLSSCSPPIHAGQKKSVRLNPHDKSLYQFEHENFTNAAETARLPADYTSLEDIFSSFV